MHRGAAQRWLAASIGLAAITACRSPARDKAGSADERLAALRDSEARALERNAELGCPGAVAVYEGSIDVASSDYLEVVARGDDYVDEPVRDLDRVISTSPRLRFTLDYPFERRFSGAISGVITLRSTIDAIRAGFRTMYDGASVEDIPGMENKDVRGSYGHAYHAIGDLVIERIELCADDSLRVSIGS